MDNSQNSKKDGSNRGDHYTIITSQKSKTLDPSATSTSLRDKNDQYTILKRTHSWFDFMTSPFTSHQVSSSRDSKRGGNRKIGAAANESSAKIEGGVFNIVCSDNQAESGQKLTVVEAYSQTSRPIIPSTNNKDNCYQEKVCKAKSSFKTTSSRHHQINKSKHKSRRFSDKCVAHKACQTPFEWIEDLDLELSTITSTNDRHRCDTTVYPELNTRDQFCKQTIKLSMVGKYHQQAAPHLVYSKTNGRRTEMINSRHENTGNGWPGKALFDLPMGLGGIGPDSYLARSMAQTFKPFADDVVTLPKADPLFVPEEDGGDDGNCDSSLSSSPYDTHTPSSVHSDNSPQLSPSPQLMPYPSASPLDSEAIIAEIERFCLKHGVLDNDAKEDHIMADTKQRDGRMPPLPFQTDGFDYAHLNLTTSKLEDDIVPNLDDLSILNSKCTVPVGRGNGNRLSCKSSHRETHNPDPNNHSDDDLNSWDGMKKFYKERITVIPPHIIVNEPKESQNCIPYPFNKMDKFGFLKRSSPDGASSPPTLGPQGKIGINSGTSTIIEPQAKEQDSKATYGMAPSMENLYDKYHEYHHRGEGGNKGSTRFQYLPVPTKVNFVLKPSVYSAFSAVNNGRLHHPNKSDDILY